MLNLYNLPKDNQPTTKQEEEKNSVAKKVDFTTYTDPEKKLSAKNIKWGMWLAKNRILLHRLLTILLFLLIAIGWGFSLYKWARYFLNYSADQNTLAALTKTENYSKINQNFSALPLQVAGLQIITSGINKQDVIADVYNPNKNHIVFFDYQFVSGNNKTEIQSFFILPLQSRPVGALGIDSSVSYSNPNFLMQNVFWKKIDPHKISNVDSYQNDHLNFTVSDFKYTPAYSGSKNVADAGSVYFKLKNGSPFDYKPSLFYVGLYYGGNFVGVMPLYLDKFLSLAEKEIDLRTLVPNLMVDQVKIYPIINIYDPSVYLEAVK